MDPERIMAIATIAIVLAGTICAAMALWIRRGVSGRGRKFAEVVVGVSVLVGVLVGSSFIFAEGYAMIGWGFSPTLIVVAVGVGLGFAVVWFHRRGKRFLSWIAATLAGALVPFGIWAQLTFFPSHPTWMR